MRDLTSKQQRYAEYRLSGYPPVVSARLAGYADNGGSGSRWKPPEKSFAPLGARALDVPRKIVSRSLRPGSHDAEHGAREHESE